MVCTRVTGTFVFPVSFSLIILNIYLCFWWQLHIGLVFKEPFIWRTSIFPFWVVITAPSLALYRYRVLFIISGLKRKNHAFFPWILPAVFLPTHQAFLKLIPVWNEDFTMPFWGSVLTCPLESFLWKGTIVSHLYFCGVDCAFWPMRCNSVFEVLDNPVSAISFIRITALILESLIS